MSGQDSGGITVSLGWGWAGLCESPGLWVHKQGHFGTCSSCS